jgi:hypothetical protein
VFSIAGLCGLLALLSIFTVVLLFGLLKYTAGLVSALPVSSASPAYEPSATARADIPLLYLHLYQAAASKYRLDWTILAGIGTVECDNGEDPAPSCNTPGDLNYAGAGGPAQFLVSTWRVYGVTPTGQGTPDMWNPADAIYSMANYLRASGAPQDYMKAIFAYNHAWWYVREVLAWARRYRATYDSSTTIITPADARSAPDPTATRHPRRLHEPR